MQLFENRVDKLGLRVVQHEVKHADVELEPNPDKYLQLNEGLEILSKLDDQRISFNNKKYPVWCFLGQDQDEFSEKTVDESGPFVSWNDECGLFTDIQVIQQAFEENRQDQIKFHEILPNG